MKGENEMKNYVNPEIEIVKLSADDIITKISTTLNPLQMNCVVLILYQKGLSHLVRPKKS